MKSSVQSKADECKGIIKSCNEKTEILEKFYTEKKYAEFVKFYDDGNSSHSNFESKCICDDKMKSSIDDARKQSAQQKADNEQKQLDEAQAMLEQMQEMKYKCNPIVPGDGVSSPTHTKHLKKLVFAKSEIVKGQEVEANFTNTFNLTDNIYSRAYLEKSIGFESGNIGDCYGGYSFIRWTFNDGATKMPEWLGENNNTTGAEKTWTTWQPAISPAGTDLNNDVYGIKNFVKIVRNLPVGTHKIKMEAVYDIPKDEEPAPPARYIENCRLYTTKFGPEKVLATGEFTLNVTEEGKKALYKKVCPLYKETIADYNRAAFTLVPNATALVKSSTNIDWSKFTLLKIVGTNDWTYKKNYYGIILSRSTSGTAYLLNKETNFIHRSNCNFYQENISSGGASYGPTTFDVEEQNIEFVRAFDSFCKECIGK